MNRKKKGVIVYGSSLLTYDLHGVRSELGCLGSTPYINTLVLSDTCFLWEGHVSGVYPGPIEDSVRVPHHKNKKIKYKK